MFADIKNVWLRWRYPESFKAADVATTEFLRAHPDTDVSRVLVRRVETDRIVVAVIYKRQHASRGMPPYRLFGIRRDLSSVDELEKHGDSPYALRGIK